jgi:hypothetical protein
MENTVNEFKISWKTCLKAGKITLTNILIYVLFYIEILHLIDLKLPKSANILD